MVHGKKQIVQSLNLLAKNKCMVSATFDSGKHSFMTVLITVLVDKDMVILDYGPDEKVNQKLLSGRRVVFATTYQGVRTQFSADKVTRVKYKGDLVFAAPIPDALLWLERREYYRVKVLLSAPARCRIRLEDGENSEFSALDISITGAALVARGDDRRLPDDIDTGSILPGCRLSLPESDEAVALEVRYRMPLANEKALREERIGFAFIDPDQKLQSKVLQYMQTVERHRKQLDR